MPTAVTFASNLYPFICVIASSYLKLIVITGVPVDRVFSLTLSVGWVT
jgi:hypothetical protein